MRSKFEAVGANLILIPRYSYFAAAWITVATEVLITLWMFWLIKKEAGTTTDKTVIFKAAIATVVMLVIMRPFLGNFVWATAAAVSYFPILFLLGGFTREDLREIISLKK